MTTKTFIRRSIFNIFSSSRSFREKQFILIGQFESSRVLARYVTATIMLRIYDIVRPRRTKGKRVSVALNHEDPLLNEAARGFPAGIARILRRRAEKLDLPPPPPPLALLRYQSVTRVRNLQRNTYHLSSTLYYFLGIDRTTGTAIFSDISALVQQFPANCIHAYLQYEC